MKMTSEIGRILKCLTNKSYHSLQDDAYSHISLIPQGDTSADSTDCPSTSSVYDRDDADGPYGSVEKIIRVRRPRSAGDISESLVLNSFVAGGSYTQDIVIESNSSGGTIGRSQSDLSSQVQSVISPNNSSGNNNHSHTNSQNNHHNLSSGNHSSNNSSREKDGVTSGGIFSFFGVRFNKLGTRHLDRSGNSSEITVEKPNKCVGDHRYTKFPLSTSSSPTGSIGPNPVGTGNNSALFSPSSQPYYPNKSNQPIHIHCTNSGVNSSSPIVPLPTNSPFDVTHIHLTPQTKTYSHPNKSPAIPRRGSDSNSNSFLANAVHSLGRKAVNSVNSSAISKSSNHFRNKPLTVKSKSDNSLHKVTLNSSSSIIGRTSGQFGGVCSTVSSSSGCNQSSSQAFSYPVGEQRLNSVQLGDHATIRLPWTGFQQNNLSSVTPSRTHPNTHNNNLDFETARYVECGSGWNTGSSARKSNSNSGNVNSSYVHSNNGDRVTSSRESRNQFQHLQTRTLSSAVASSSSTRRRSRSLERASNFRIFPVNSNSIPFTNTTNNSGKGNCASLLLGSVNVPKPSNIKNQDKKEKDRERARLSLSLERDHISQSHRVRQSLSQAEQEILLRNISTRPANNPPPSVLNSKSTVRDKPIGLKNVIIGCSHTAQTHSDYNKKSHLRQVKSKQPHIGRLHRSAPNSSFSNSSESSDSASVSAPPSPPPRPPSTLKPESRLILPPKKTGKAKHCEGSNIITSGGNNNSVILNSMNSVPNRRPIPPRSQESSSDSGHSRSSGIATLTGNSSDISGAESIQSLHSQSSSLAAAAAGAGMSLEDARNSGFINKPTKGWLHSDQLLSKEGVTYVVRYIGCLDVNTSMKSLDFDTRSLIAKECINQVCESAGLKSIDRKRKIDRRVVRILGFRPRLDHAGSDVHLTITSTCLKLTSLETGAIIAVHDMPNISFASGGDTTMLDFVAYVAKDSIVGRACFVLECGSGLAQDVITTVGQAFELRFKEYLQKRPQPPRLPNDDPEYYNDLPGKVPPDISQDAKNKIISSKSGGGGRGKDPPLLTLPTSDKDLGVNLIDFEAPTPPAFGPSVQDKNLESLLLLSPSSVSTASTATVASNSQGNGIGNGLGLPNSPGQVKDPFDMQPFGNSLPVSVPMSESEQKIQLQAETWYHGTISRGEAEALVRNDGDFLVRESQTTPGQYVLTGLQSGSPKHLLLVDPEGVVRTKDRTFDSVIHLIHYHSDNSLPIISAESMVLLRHPVSRVISS